VIPVIISTSNTTATLLEPFSLSQTAKIVISAIHGNLKTENRWKLFFFYHMCLVLFL